MILLISIVVFFVVIEIVYFYIADRFNIIDKPNERSSHTKITLRGGGIIFPIAWLLWFALSKFQLPYITLGVLLLAIVSFWDDVKTLSSTKRFGTQFIAIGLLFFELDIFHVLAWWQSAIAFVLCVGCLNAINFMDGINGMTGLYSLVVFSSIFFVGGNSNGFIIDYIEPKIILILSILVFGFFNFRKKAMCFAGDVGSIPLGFIMIALLFQLIYFYHNVESSTFSNCSEFSLLDYIKNENYLSTSKNTFDFSYILFLAIYGIDAMCTIFQRLWNKENILTPHRKHLYQYLANEMKWPHLLVSGMYAILQLIINALIISGVVHGMGCLLLLFALGAAYVLIKARIYRRYVRH